MNNKLEELASSEEIFLKAEKIGNKFNLHLDQIGELDRRIKMVIMREAKSADFVKDIMKSLEIDKGIAIQITEEVNTEVFEVIKDKLQEAGVNESNMISIEEAGGFVIERPKIEDEPNIKHSDSAMILNQLENPSGSTNNSNKIEEHVDPLIDHLLSSPSSNNIEEISTQTNKVEPPVNLPREPEEEKPLVNEQKPVTKGSDPYRESTL